MLLHRFRWCGNTTCQLERHYTTCQGQNRQDDAHHCVCIHHLLVTLHHLRSAAGLWPDTALADQHSHSDIHTEPGAAQLGCQSAYLLPLLLAGVPHVQVSRAGTSCLITTSLLSLSLSLLAAVFRPSSGSPAAASRTATTRSRIAATQWVDACTTAATRCAH